MVRVKTIYDKYIEESNGDSIKDKLQEKTYISNYQPCYQSDCTTELFKIFGCSVCKYHLDMITIGLQLILIIILINKNK